MKTFLLGAAVGYVLGTKAGRARYDQIVRTYRKVVDHPMVQGAAGVARAKVGEKVGDKVPFLRPQGRNGHRVGEPTVTQA
ncbi:hypothetical protein [Amycolatopsis alkalitolerans]|uniref:YtxH domain-containing protein n=1 Tax=Amycolatopsis alkalitolerans TaxID=2547244 RepID=A0A5C4M6M4_9PSEU|nr:hypothetical protein [Amycolatopsis alkalitolerans]TNC27618.1 hypothetical protein FG385_07750 [Amycolatopsis alkalitolerans]